MGTRALIHIHDGIAGIRQGIGQPIITTIYSQFDGYPTGLGNKLAAIIRPLKIVNGMRNEGPEANGMGCLAALIIKALKDGPGGIYLHVPGAFDQWEEYTYHIYLHQDEVHMACLEVSQSMCRALLFHGCAADFDGEAIEQQMNEEGEAA